MAEEADKSLEDLVGNGESDSDPKEDTNTPNGVNGATTTTTTVTTTTTTTTTTRTTTATTTTISSKKKDHSCTVEKETEGGGGTDVDSKIKTGGDSSSAGSSGGRGTRLRHRIYRPRLFESSSEDSDEGDKVVTRRLRPRGAAGEVAGRDSASPVSTEPGQDEVEMDPTSPEGMETTGRSTDDATDDSPTIERRIVTNERNRGGRSTMFGGLLSDTDSDSDDDTGRRRSLNPIEDETRRKEVEAAINTELMRIKQRPKPKHEWNFVDQIIKRFVTGCVLFVFVFCDWIVLLPHQDLLWHIWDQDLPVNSFGSVCVSVV
ncbi:hypothetical protein GWK47_031128 [Chionoecetes opilio]|uniref:Uncharacterized protein n=1 Tax=Chionoecetes opilio TaxID=41210 RepID=A0A8J4Z130_CHIOP|nr:hypothetical protein GWK47_031128 [Chionoecetes opilio]